MHKRNYKKGFVETIILIIVALIVLGYFNIDLRKVFSTPQVQENLRYGWEIAKLLYHYVKETIMPLILPKS